MQNRREFLDTLAKGTGAACAGIAFAATAQEATPTGAATQSRLVDVLKAAGKPTETVAMPDGTTVLLLPYGGRVLGLFAPGNEHNFYWTHPALGAPETAREFYASKEWHNSGGDRTWLAPEVDVFLPKFPDTATYWQPRELDPGAYEIASSEGTPRLVNTLRLRLARSGAQVDLLLAKSFGPAANPLRHEKNMDLQGLAYAGYTQYTQLELRDPAADTPAVGLWNLVQMPHGGDLLIPTYSRTEPKLWFGTIGPDDLIVGDRLVRYRMRATGEHKLGVRAVATTGRVGYLHGAAGDYTLIVRNFVVNPSGEYVDVPWKDPDDFGYSTQACNVNSKLGAFSELEYHIPAIGGKSGRLRCDDAAQVWAFRGPEDQILKAARRLLSPEV